MKVGTAIVVTPLSFTDEELLTVQNGIVLEIKRTAQAGQIGAIEHSISLFRKIQPAVDKAIERLKALQEAETKAQAEPASENTAQ